MKYESKSDNSFLRLHYDQLIITSDSKVLESLNLYNKIKGIHKDDVLILFVSVSGKEVSFFPYVPTYPTFLLDYLVPRYLG